MANEVAIYRLFAAAGDLLYVGVADDALRRLRQHREDKPWWANVSRIDLQVFSSRQEAMAAETKAIKSEHPLHNRVHNRKPPPPKRVKESRHQDLGASKVRMPKTAPGEWTTWADTAAYLDSENVCVDTLNQIIIERWENGIRLLLRRTHQWLQIHWHYLNSIAITNEAWSAWECLPAKLRRGDRARQDATSLAYTVERLVIVLGWHYAQIPNWTLWVLGQTGRAMPDELWQAIREGMKTYADLVQQGYAPRKVLLNKREQ